jgi:hypothetical protein
MRLAPVVTTLSILLLAAPAGAAEYRSLDGSGNNVAHPDWGKAGTPYKRVAPTAYGDGVGSIADGPNARYVSNRVFNDIGQNIFSERGVTQWAWTWGQFMDHTFGLAESSTESSPIAFNAADPLETFENTLGAISFKRDKQVDGQQVNTVSSYIDGWNVYGGTGDRLEWLRDGAHLLLPDGYLPTAAARGDAASAPSMAVDGGLRSHPQDRVVAGDVRANENIALTAVHTLFAREHNRIVDSLPAGMRDEDKFQIARRIVGAEEQFITYNEFLPSLGVRLRPYRGYRPNVDPSLGNEFATVGYRAHSMIHGEFEFEVNGEERVVTLEDGFFNPALVPEIGLDNVLAGLSAESQYNNDEQMDNALRSVMFQIPNGPKGVVDLGALDVQRARDHGIPNYNALRRAFGLRSKTSFRAITGERSETMPAGTTIDSPAILDYVKLFNAEGALLDPESEEGEESAIFGARRAPLAARLKAIYGSVENVDAFVGMVSERHVRGTEFGELQLAMWRQQFEALRDGDRFFHLNDPMLRWIKRRFGIDYRQTVANLIALNTDVAQADLPRNVFRPYAEKRAPAGKPRRPRHRPRRPGRGRDQGSQGVRRPNRRNGSRQPHEHRV